MARDLEFESNAKLGRQITSTILVFALVAVGLWGLIKLVKYARRPSGYLDYMPTAIQPCPSDYRCGATSREQVAMENRLFVDLRENEKYSLPATLTSDQIDVVATEAEPTSCMVKRAAAAKEGSMPEGQYTPWDEIEGNFLMRKEKKPMQDQPVKTLG